MTSAPGYEDQKRRLVDLMVRTGALQFSPAKKFVLASGEESEFYFDLRLLNGDPEGINAVAGAFYHQIRDVPGIASAGGLESGSIPIATAVSQLSYLKHQRDPSSPLIRSFYVRKSQKSHGTKKMIEGNPASPAVILDDVVTSGRSAITAVNVARDAGHTCELLMSIIFRGTEEQRKEIEKTIPLRYVFAKDELVAKFKERHG